MGRKRATSATPGFRKPPRGISNIAILAATAGLGVTCRWRLLNRAEKEAARAGAGIRPPGTAPKDKAAAMKAPPRSKKVRRVASGITVGKKYAVMVLGV
jgi:hypothetical protein